MIIAVIKFVLKPIIKKANLCFFNKMTYAFPPLVQYFRRIKSIRPEGKRFLEL